MTRHDVRVAMTELKTGEQGADKQAGRINKRGGRRERPRDRERGAEELTGRDETSRPLPLVMATP